MTCCFSTKPISQAQLDPAKRVNYSLGLVLGEEEFKQEQYYFASRGALRNRLLHGYGTATGLRITAKDTEITVSPGWAVDGLGRDIHIDQDQCADLDKWLGRKENRAKLEAAISTSPAPAGNPSLYLVLAYRECCSDDVPIPGEPCRSEGDTMAPSRITETFDLKFMLAKPSQLEEKAIRLFPGLLARLRVDPALGGKTAEQARADLDAAVRGLINPLLGLPPLPAMPSPPPLYIHPDRAREAYDRIFLLWVTELRPSLWQKEAESNPGPESCPKGALLLGRIDFAVNVVGTNLAVSGPIAIAEDERPYLLSTRMLQEVEIETGSAANPAFVHATAGPYAIVAAGHFAGGGDAVGPTYNGLYVKSSGPSLSDYLLVFSGYNDPTGGGGHTYIVKGVVQTDAVPGNPPGSLQFIGYAKGGIQVRLVGLTGTPIPASGFMVEISRFGGAG